MGASSVKGAVRRQRGLAALGLLVGLSCGYPAASDARPTSTTTATITVGFWNVANLFHPDETGPGRRSGMARVSPQKYARKLGGLARGLVLMGDGDPPEVVALAEVGSDRALADLVARPELQGTGYRAVRLDGPDGRGISNAVLTRLPLAGAPEHHIVHAPGEPPTRAVLEVRMKLGATTLVVFVNHWPSKRGGDGARAQREAIARRVSALVEASASEDPDTEVLVLGDFNAYLDERVFDGDYLNASAVEAEVRSGRARFFHTIDDVAEAAWGRTIDDLDEVRAAESARSFGTYVYRRRWGTLDGILVHRRLLDDTGLAYVEDSATIVRHRALIYVVNRGRPNAYDKPDRDVSDHLPVTVDVRRTGSK